MQRLWTRREALRNISLAATGAVLAACTSAATPSPEPTKPSAATAPAAAPTPTVASAPKTSSQYKLVANFGIAAMPSDPKVPVPAGQKERIGLGQAAKDYTAKHPNVTIEWYYIPQGISGFEWLQARIAAQDAPDIYNFSADSLFPHLAKGWALDLTDWFKQPNPYMPGKRPWRSYLNDVAYKSQIGPDGKVYGLCLNGGGPIICYNKDVFDQAGVKEVPRTWNEYIAAQEAIKKTGVTPLAERPHCCYYHWAYGHIVNQLLYDKILSYDDNGDGFVTSKELVQHTLKGDWPLWDIEMKFADLTKQQAPYLPSDFLGNPDSKQLFRRGKAAIYLTGANFARELINDPVPFKTGWMQYPILTKENWPDAQSKRIRLDGPWGTINSHLPGYLNKTAPDRVPVIMDFLMWITQPRYLATVTEETGNVPFVEGVPVPEYLKPWMEPYDRAVALQSWYMLNESVGAAIMDLIAQYWFDRIDGKTYIEKAKQVWADGVRKQLELNPEWKL